MVAMRPFPTSTPLQQALDRVARENYGVLWTEILHDLGVTRSQIRTHVRRGEWKKIGQRLYVVAAVSPSWEQSLMLICRRAPGRTWVSGRAAARLWDLDGFSAEIVEVSTTANLRAPSPEAVIHHLPTMPANDATVFRGLPVTSVHRTLIDLGNEVDPDAVELAYECARRRRRTNDEWLLRRIEGLGTQGRAGPAILKAIIERHSRAAAPTGSALEVRFLQLNRRFLLPEPERQRIVLNRDGSTARVDFIYPGTVVIVEVDGRSIHDRKRQWEKDLRRRNRLTAKGFRVLHVTYERMRSDPNGIAEEINAALGRSFV
jgi:very-short-patch-repair endonuclease